MKKRIRNFISIMAIVLAFCFALTACGGATDSESGSTGEPTSSSSTGNRARYGNFVGQSVGNAHCGR